MSGLSKTELRKKIADILKGADLAKTSAKKVREELEEDLGVDLKTRKKEIDALVMDYVKSKETKNGDAAGDDEEEEENEEEDEEEEEAKDKKKGVKRGAAGKKTPAKKGKKDDSEDASEHSDEESDNYSAKKSKPPKARKLPPKKKRGSDSGTDEDYKKEKPRKSGGKRGGSGYTKSLKLSPELADLVGQESMARHEVVKKVWAIIKERELFDPKNRQFAICDAALLKVFGTKRFRTFGMMKYLKKHFIVA